MENSKQMDNDSYPKEIKNRKIFTGVGVGLTKSG
jgi:hypothetical protein